MKTGKSFQILDSDFFNVAKNKSEYIYYSKYKEISNSPKNGPLGLENSTKNGIISGTNDVKKRKYTKKGSTLLDNTPNESQLKHQSISMNNFSEARID